MINKKYWLLILLMFLTLCFVNAQTNTLSIEQLTREVQASIVIELNNNLMNGVYVEEELRLVRRTETEYIGSIEVQQNGYWRGGELEITVIFDGRSFRWTANPTDFITSGLSSYRGSGRIITAPTIVENNNVQTDNRLNGTWTVTSNIDNIHVTFVLILNNGNFGACLKKCVNDR